MRRVGKRSLAWDRAHCAEVLCLTLRFSEFFQWQEFLFISAVLKLAFDYFIHTKRQKLPRLCSLEATTAPDSCLQEAFYVASAESE